MATIGKNDQNANVYHVINDNQENIINNIDNMVSTETLTSAICNYFSNDDVNSFLEFLHNEGIIEIDELDELDELN